MSNRLQKKLELAIPIALFAIAFVAPLFYCCRTTSMALDVLPQLFQLNGLALAVSALVSMYLWINRASKRSREDLIVAVAFSFTAAFLLAVVNNAGARPSFDYQCIQNGATKILHGQLPYGQDTGYFLYPPLYAQAMAKLYWLISFVGRQIHWHPSAAQTFNVIFYLFQNMQVLAVAALMSLSYKFARTIGAFSKVNSAVLSCAIIALNYPVFGTIQWNQVNIYITCLIMFAVLFSARKPVTSGLALALGIHLKGYPILLLPALCLAKQWKTCASAVIWTAAIALVTTIGFGSQIWTTYFHVANAFVASINANPPTYMVDGSNLFSCVFVLFKMIQDGPVDTARVCLIASSIKLALALWFLWRLGTRHFGQAKEMVERTRFFDDVADLLSFGLLAGPTTLNHHYVLAIPIILWTIIRSGATSPFQILLGTLMITNFQSHITSLMTLSPIGLILLTWSRRDSNKKSVLPVSPDAAQAPAAVAGERGLEPELALAGDMSVTSKRN